MVRVTAYADSKGTMFKTPEEAAISDLASLLGAGAEGMASGIARSLFSNRSKLEEIFAEYDDCTAIQTVAEEKAA